MKIASAQIKASIGEMDRNAERHYRMIDLASENGVDLIIFPEMSLTGYCREEAKGLAMTQFDERLDELKKKAREGNIAIVVGAPIEMASKLYIGSFILLPHRAVKIYVKQFLHDGEERFYGSSFENNPTLQLGDEKISFAICADIEHDVHPQKAGETGSSIYLPSIFYSRNGIDGGIEKLSGYAEKYGLNILMSNFCGKLWNTEAGGKSCFINRKGEVQEKLVMDAEGLLVMEKKNDQWIGSSIEVLK
ncbi:MAG: carbon-nitrogen hydrolase family protein [Bacteroidota bacterium]